MTEEKFESKCLCKSEIFKKFLVTALGTFTGVYAALSLFTAIHKPPMMMPPCPMGYGPHPQFSAPCPFKHHGHFDKGFRGDKRDFQKAVEKQQGPAPFEIKKAYDKN